MQQSRLKNWLNDAGNRSSDFVLDTACAAVYLMFKGKTAVRDKLRTKWNCYRQWLQERRDYIRTRKQQKAQIKLMVRKGLANSILLLSHGETYFNVDAFGQRRREVVFKKPRMQRRCVATPQSIRTK